MFLQPGILDSIQRTLAADLRGFTPELVLCVGIVVLLLLRLLPSFDRLHLGWVSLAFSLGALAYAVADWVAPGESVRDLFTGLLRFDRFTLFLRLFLLAFTTLVIWLSLLTRIPD